MDFDTRTVKASFKDSPLSERARYKGSSVLMPISVGQPIHEGKKLEAALSLAVRCFKECTLLVDDVVQRYTLRINKPYSNNEAYLRAKYLGDKWLQRNQGILRKFPQLKVIRWEHWLSHENFQAKFAQVEHFYQYDDYYYHALEETASVFMRRYNIKHADEHIDQQRGHDLCIEYLHEEMAAMCLWAEAGYQFELYPHGRNTAFNATYELMIEPFYPHLLRSVALRFKKYPGGNAGQSVKVDQIAANN